MKRDISVDIVKFIAVFLIINSHADIMYPHLSVLATGGAIGDCLFLFVSGFTLFLGEMKPFPSFYKRRINRIFPSVIASVLFIHLITLSPNIPVVEFLGGGFIEAIMIYYILLWLIRKFVPSKTEWIVFAVLVFSFVVYLLFFPYKYETGYKGMYGITTPFRWIPYFGFMLMGACVGLKRELICYSLKKDIFVFFVCLFLFYGIQLSAKHYSLMAPFQIFTLIPLMGIVYYLYKICHCRLFADLYKTKVGNKMIMLVSGLCLESYLIQFNLITDKLNSIWPLNLLLISVFIIACSYIVRCMARFFMQTFQKDDYNWQKIIEI
ncbi:MAG: acyltransferase family protein [Bacteroidales bacterium]|nr:acyltransferase family protein [Bacteroidales bacterium]